MSVGATAVAPRRHRVRWPWWLLGVLLLLAGVSTLAARPWATAEPSPFPTPEQTETQRTTPGTLEPSVLPTLVSPVFTAENATRLFLTRDELEESVPAAADGLTAWPVVPWVWGLPVGSSVEPPSCLVARIVVAQPPTAFDVRGWDDAQVVVRQQVVVLPDEVAAGEAFRTLVATVDACPTYTQIDPGAGGGTWTVEPATEAQGRYPSLWQEVRHSAEGRTTAGYQGHLLVGNTIVSWVVESLADHPDVADARASLGTGSALDGLVQQRVSEAVAALP